MSAPQAPAGNGGLPPPPPPPPPMSTTAKPVAAAFDGGSPINNGNADDDLDFEKELLDGGMGGNGNGGAPILEQSRIESADFESPQPVKKPLPPPKAPVLSFSEMIAQAAAGLKKNPVAGASGDGKKEAPIPIPKKGGVDKEESKKDAAAPRMSNMDALKNQIMLRKQAMNPGNAKKGDDAEEEKKRNNLAALSMKMSKFGNDDDMDEEESASSESDDD